ncbi:ICP22 family protein [Thiohalorhabdus denitrificans]|uniref:PEP-CTERM protein-sorting domain-containing protein n=1 Tax=Thiohalorhabdus denitrificans TaxID=381306 RepID=A0A1G5C351_9GAMM|nr:hypothetical protein [Thiohalorhabdus denitrificans]SCX96798.1 PEP-CTERM protein-sorting domain-containing protein [Thiohalorhabdus denitrificans]
MASAKRIRLCGLFLLTAPALAWGAPFSADLQPLNDSGVSGNAGMELEGDSLDVEINASGLEPNETHPQHIHGPPDSPAALPGMDADADGDGFIELEEATTTVGPVILPLTSTPDGAQGPAPQANQAPQGGPGPQNAQGPQNGNGPQQGELPEQAQQMDQEQLQEMDQDQQADQDQDQEGNGNGGEGGFPIADEDGNINFSATYDLSDEDIFGDDFSRDDLLPMEQRAIVLHGLSTTEEDGVGTEGEVDGTAGYKEVLPVAGGAIVAEADDGAEPTPPAEGDGPGAPDAEIPEPGVLSLLAMGMLAFLGGFGRRFGRLRG